MKSGRNDDAIYVTSADGKQHVTLAVQEDDLDVTGQYVVGSAATEGIAYRCTRVGYKDELYKCCVRKLPSGSFGIELGEKV